MKKYLIIALAMALLLNSYKDLTSFLKGNLDDEEYIQKEESDTHSERNKNEKRNRVRFKKISIDYSGVILYKKKNIIYSNREDGFFYEDTNQNNLIEKNDKGFFQPGRLISIFIVYAFLIDNEINYQTREVIESALIRRDNLSLSVLIRETGMNRMNSLLQDNNFKHTILSRYPGTKRSALKSKCRELGDYGNCTSIQDVVSVFENIFSSDILKEDQKRFLSNTLSRRPFLNFDNFVQVFGRSIKDEQGGRWFSVAGMYKEGVVVITSKEAEEEFFKKETEVALAKFFAKIK